MSLPVSHLEGTDRAAVWPRLVLFDLDGTLIDSVPGIAASLNELLAQDGQPAYSTEAVRHMVGHGFSKLIARAYQTRGSALDADAVSERHARMEEIYSRLLTGGTTLMAGAAEFFALSLGAPWQLAVITNKPQESTDAIIDHFGLTNAFALIVGDSGMPLKPAPDMLLYALRRLEVDKSEAVMVGDSAADIAAARAAGIRSIAVSGGYSLVEAAALGADAVIASLHELPRALMLEARSRHAMR